MFTECKNDIERAYNVLDAGQAACSNVTAINGWLADGYITADEAKALKAYNRQLEKQNQ